jgi:hypothetical protein
LGVSIDEIIGKAASSHDLLLLGAWHCEEINAAMRIQYPAKDDIGAVRYRTQAA